MRPWRQQFWIVKHGLQRACFIIRFRWRLKNNRSVYSSPFRLRSWTDIRWLWCCGPEICRLQCAGGNWTQVALLSSWRWVHGHSVQNVKNDWFWTWNHPDKEWHAPLQEKCPQHHHRPHLQIWTLRSFSGVRVVLGLPHTGRDGPFYNHFWPLLLVFVCLFST